MALPEPNPLVEFENWLRQIAERKTPISIKEAAELTGMSVDYIRDNQGKIGYFKFGSEIRFIPAAFVAWLRSRYVTPKLPRNRLSPSSPEPH